MALVECKACKAEISNRAKSCPKCGEPIKKTGGCIGLLLGVLVGLVIIIFIVSGEKEPVQSINTVKQDSIVKLFKSDKEKIAKDALWINGGRTLRVGVIDDGTRRDGYADYVCQVLKDYGFSGVRVVINDIVKIVRNNEWVELGKSKCK